MRHGDVISLGGLSTAKDAVCFRLLLHDDAESSSNLVTLLRPTRILTRKRHLSSANSNRLPSESEDSPAEMESECASHKPPTQRLRRSILSEEPLSNVPLPNDCRTANSFYLSLDTTCLSYVPGSNAAVPSPFAASASAVKDRHESVNKLTTCTHNSSDADGIGGGSRIGFNSTNKHHKHSFERQQDDAESVQEFDDDTDDNGGTSIQDACNPISNSTNYCARKDVAAVQSDKLLAENSVAEESVQEYDDDKISGPSYDYQSSPRRQGSVVSKALPIAQSGISEKSKTTSPEHAMEGALDEKDRASIEKGAVNTSSPGGSIGDFSLSDLSDPHTAISAARAIAPLNKHMTASHGVTCLRHGNSSRSEVEAIIHAPAAVLTRKARNDDNLQELSRVSFGTQESAREEMQQSVSAARHSAESASTATSAAVASTPLPSGALAYMVEWPSALLSGSTQNSRRASPQSLPPSTVLTSREKPLHLPPSLLEPDSPSRVTCDNQAPYALTNEPSSTTVEDPDKGALSYKTTSREILPMRTNTRKANSAESSSLSSASNAFAESPALVTTTYEPHDSKDPDLTSCPPIPSVGENVGGDGIRTGVTGGDNNKSVSFISETPPSEHLSNPRSRSNLQRTSPDDSIESRSTITGMSAAPLPQRAPVLQQVSNSTDSPCPEHASGDLGNCDGHYDPYIDSLGSRSSSICNSSNSLTAETPVMRIGLTRGGHGGSLGAANAPDSCEDSLIIGGTQASQLAGLARVRGANETQVTQNGGNSFSLDGDTTLVGDNSRSSGRELGAVRACVCGLPPDAVVGNLVPNAIAQPRSLQTPLHWCASIIHSTSVVQITMGYNTMVHYSYHTVTVIYRFYQPGINRALNDVIAVEGNLTY